MPAFIAKDSVSRVQNKIQMRQKLICFTQNLVKN